jgi:phage shock protein PspC (stress-responsive transcriptional regulator)
LAPGVTRKLAGAGEYLAVAPTVVRVVRDAPIPPFEDRLPTHPADPERLLELAGRWGIDSSLARLVEALSKLAGRSPDE